MDDNFNTRKVVAYLIGGILLLILITQVIHYFNTGTIIVTTNDPNGAITLRQVSASGDSDDKSSRKSFKTFTGHKNLSVKVSLGQYVASVQGNSIGAAQVIKLTSHKTLRYTINPVDATGVEPVAYQSAQNLAADQNSLVYLDSNSRNLYRIDNQNNLTIIGQNHAFQSVQWANANFGIGQDTTGHLYVIDGDSVTPLKLPFSYNDDTPAAYSVSSHGQIYVSSGTNIYSGTQKGGFKQIYTAKTSRLSLIAGPTQLLVKEPLNAEDQSNVIAVDSSGKASTKNFDLGLTAWSPNGRYLASASEGGGVIYDNQQGGSTAIPNLSKGAFIGGISWLNNQTLLYSTGDQVWIYNNDTRQARLLSNMPLGNAAVGVSVSDDGAYLYVLTGNGAGTSGIKRIGLRGQQVPDFMYQLQDILPDQQANYSLSLINFTQPPTPPVILVQPFPDAAPRDYIQAATAELQTNGFNTNQVQLRLSSSIPGQ